MKILSITDINYIQYAHNFYLQLKKYNLHKKWILYCDTQETLDSVMALNLDCDIRLHKQTLPNRWADHPHFLPVKAENRTNTNIVDASDGYYVAINLFKQEMIYNYLNEYKNCDVIYSDLDVAVFGDFVTPLTEIIESNVGHEVKRLNFGFKHYIIVRRDLDRDPQYSGWNRSLVNCGFMFFVNSEDTRRYISEYHKEITDQNLGENCGYKYCGNVDEIVLTNFIEKNICTTIEIPDQINMIRGLHCFWTPQQILNFKPLTYHTIFTSCKKEFLQSLGAWHL